MLVVVDISANVPADDQILSLACCGVNLSPISDQTFLYDFSVM